MEIEKPRARVSTLQLIRISFFAFALIVAFLFALNGRYTKEDDYTYFDKWTKTILYIVREKAVE